MALFFHMDVANSALDFCALQTAHVSVSLGCARLACSLVPAALLASLRQAEQRKVRTSSKLWGICFGWRGVTGVLQLRFLHCGSRHTTHVVQLLEVHLGRQQSKHTRRWFGLALLSHMDVANSALDLCSLHTVHVSESSSLVPAALMALLSPLHFKHLRDSPGAMILSQ